MINEVRISTQNLKLTAVNSRKLINLLNERLDLGTIIINTGLSYDSNIEDEGEDSESSFTEIIYYVNGDEEKCIFNAQKSIQEIGKLLKIPIEGYYFTLTDIENINQY